MADIYPLGPTHTEELNEIIVESAKEIAEPDTTMIQKLIDEHNTEPLLKGVRYYMCENDIEQKRRTYYDAAGQLLVDETKTNNRTSHAWHKLFVDQKTQYLVGEPVTFTSDNKTFLDFVNELADDDFDDILNETVKNSANKGVEYWHPYVDEEGEFAYVIFPAEEVICVYKDNSRRDILFAIRYYSYKDIMGEETKKAELYTDTHVYYYELIDGVYQMDYSYGEVNPKPHMTKGGQAIGWGRVPIIPFKNNEEMVSDLKFYKDLIDDYDSITSGTMDAFSDFQQLVYVLKNYDGQDPKEFTANLRYHSVIKVAGDGGVDTLRAEIPVDSAAKELERIQDELYKAAQAVDNSPETIGGGATGPALENLYALLDLKANMTERKIRAGLRLFFWFFAEYLRNTGKGDFNPDKELTMTFTRTKIQNDNEIVQSLVQAVTGGIMSKETAVAHNPYVQDPEEEMARIEEEMNQYAEMQGNLLDDEGGDDNLEEDDPNAGAAESGGAGQVS
ncbi:portal protein [Bacillus phage 000TH010]|uniref:Portal protein n=1 Tax=Bacillus phage 000TH010 TaxID=2601652 RepID=A0A5P8PHQ0_9CAUD|nr:portal protein [Bacillus phage 000TH010]QFR56221.1 portal protein [Bacillus phage 000TH010]